jgi:hypothetical protein
MARITSYNQDTSVEGGDKLVGSSSDGTTKTYTLDAIGKYYIDNNVVSVSGQQNFKFIDNASDIGNGTFFIDGFNANGKAFSLITTLSVSKSNTQGVSIINFLQKTFEDKFRLSSVSNPDNFADILVTSIQNHPSQEGFYKLNLSMVSGQGFVYKDEIFSVERIAKTDSHFVFSQETVSATWNIEHNLNKYPSVTVVDSGDNILLTEVEYTDNNNLVVRFEASTSGKAYMN